MTDTERERVKAICEIAGVSDIEDLSDGFHTFRQLYYQRMMLFATIVKQNKDKAWKSFKHEDGELCFGGGWFIVGIDTPEGSYTYHYEDNYYSLFDCEELERGKHWDGHTEKDVTRLLALPSAKPERKTGEWKRAYLDHEAFGERPKILYCSVCNQCIAYPVSFCPNCGSDNRIKHTDVSPYDSHDPMPEPYKERKNETDNSNQTD